MGEEREGVREGGSVDRICVKTEKEGGREEVGVRNEGVRQTGGGKGKKETKVVRLVLLLRAVCLHGGRTANGRLVLLLRGAQLHGGRTANVRLAALHACFFFCSPLFLFLFSYFPLILFVFSFFFSQFVCFKNLCRMFKNQKTILKESKRICEIAPWVTASTPRFSHGHKNGSENGDSATQMTRRPSSSFE